MSAVSSSLVTLYVKVLPDKDSDKVKSELESIPGVDRPVEKRSVIVAVLPEGTITNMSVFVIVEPNPMPNQ